MSSKNYSPDVWDGGDFNDPEEGCFWLMFVIIVIIVLSSKL